MSRFKDISGNVRIKRLPRIKNIMNLNDTINYCINNKFKMDILYEENEDAGVVLNGYRSITPVAFGIHRSTENLILRAYLNEGVSKSQAVPYWRLFRLDRIHQFNINFSKTNIANKESYHEDDKHMSTIFSQLEKAFNNLLC
jgi:hypothetical protein